MLSPVTAYLCQPAQTWHWSAVLLITAPYFKHVQGLSYKLDLAHVTLWFDYFMININRSKELCNGFCEGTVFLIITQKERSPGQWFKSQMTPEVHFIDRSKCSHAKVKH